MVYEDEDKAIAVLYDKINGEWVNARPLNSTQMKTMCGNNIEPVPCFLPDRMLWYEEDQIMIWYTKPTQRKINLTKEKSRLYRHPGLIFCLRRTSGRDRLSIAVYSINEDRPPRFDDDIWHTPYAAIDVHPSGGVMGDCNVASIETENAYSLDIGSWIYWEDTFFESKFNYKPKPRNRLEKKGKQLNEWINSQIKS